MVQLMRRRRAEEETPVGDETQIPESKTRLIEAIPIPVGDPLETLLVTSGGPVVLRDLELESETVDTLREAGVELIVPLIGQGELLGALYLGPRLSDQPYSTDDRRLLGSLASQVAPAMKVAQLVREQQAEAKERERIHQELQVAALIQQTLLPKELPAIAGWQVDAFYRPARAVGGDFYDFIALEDGRLGVVIGDVTDKGVPAALGDGYLSIDVACSSPASQLSVGGSGRCQRWPGAGDPACHVRDLSLRNHRYRRRGGRVRQRRPQPALCEARWRGPRVEGHRHAPRAHAGDGLRRDQV